MDEMLNKLTALLSTVSDWLKYAEAKNAVLLGFSGAGITAILTYLSAASNIPKSINIGCLLAITLLCICSLICSLSFLPKTNLEIVVWKRKRPGRRTKGSPNNDDNLYFFGHLYKYQDHELIQALNDLYFGGSIKNINKKEYKDVASQIVVNSEIAYLKFKLFSWALYFLIFSILVTPICITISLIFSHSI